MLARDTDCWVSYQQPKILTRQTSHFAECERLGTGQNFRLLVSGAEPCASMTEMRRRAAPAQL